MLDIKFIQEHKAEVQKAIEAKNVDLNLNDLLKVHEKRAQLQQEIEELNRQKNANANKMKGTVGKPDEGLIKEGKRIKGELEKVEPEFKKLDEKLTDYLLKVPNVFSPESPIGGEDANTEIEKIGEPRNFDFEPLDHITLGEKLNLLDLERGSKVSGFRGYFLKNDLALLHWGIINLAIKKMTSKGFDLMVTPTMIKDMALLGSGHFPEAQDEIYPVRENEKSDWKYLAGTSEPALLAYRANETLEYQELPLKYAGFSPCYRREVGSYGKDTKGLYRVHEFFKVEQVVVCEANMKIANQIFDEMRDIALELLKDLELPCRILNISTGDMGAGKYRMNDIETWMPSRKGYGETHSLSFLTDWQARRLGLKYKDKDGSSKFCYTLNNTVVASPRILIAVMENYQTKEGKIEVPKVLRDFVGKKIIDGN